MNNQNNSLDSNPDPKKKYDKNTIIAIVIFLVFIELMPFIFPDEFYTLKIKFKSLLMPDPQAYVDSKLEDYRNYKYGEETEKIVKKEPKKTLSYFSKYAYYKEDNKIYIELHYQDHFYRQVEGADIDSFEVMTEYYTKDKNNVYYLGKQLKNADPKTFKILNNSYSRDRNFVYLEDKQIKEIDIKTFQFLNNSYLKDGSNVYYNGKPMNSADSDSFSVFELNNYYARDKNNVYRLGKIIQGADPLTFEFINVLISSVGLGGPYFDFEYAKDTNFVFKYGKKLENIDASTFEILGTFTNKIKKGSLVAFEHYYKDKNNIYFDEERIDVTDHNTFEVIFSKESFDFEISPWAKDKYSVYWFGKKIQDADPNSFVILSNYVGQDKNYKYENGEIVEKIIAKNNIKNKFLFSKFIYHKFS